MKFLKHFYFIPTWSQWKKWSKPSKLTTCGAFIGVVGIVIFFIARDPAYTRPIISVSKVETYIGNNYLRSKFVIENVGGAPAHLTIESYGMIDGKQIPKSETYQNSSKGPFVLMPSQIMRFRALFFEDRAFKELIGGFNVPEFSQSIKVIYGPNRDDTNEFYTYQKVKLDKDKLKKSIVNKRDMGMWILEESDAK